MDTKCTTCVRGSQQNHLGATIDQLTSLLYRGVLDFAAQVVIEVDGARATGSPKGCESVTVVRALSAAENAALHECPQ